MKWKRITYKILNIFFKINWKKLQIWYFTSKRVVTAYPFWNKLMQNSLNHFKAFVGCCGSLYIWFYSIITLSASRNWLISKWPNQLKMSFIRLIGWKTYVHDHMNAIEGKTIEFESRNLAYLHWPIGLKKAVFAILRWSTWFIYTGMWKNNFIELENDHIPELKQFFQIRKNRNILCNLFSLLQNGL